MYKEIDIGNNCKIVLFWRYDFWTKILDKVKDTTESIDIVTYNFRFEDQRGHSFYNKLLTIAEKGIRIRLMYSPSVSHDEFCDDLFGDEILCVSVPHNHSKIFISDTLAFIGSANFTLGSDNNCECGFLTENRELIQKLRVELINSGIFSKMDFDIISEPCIHDPLSLVQDVIKDLEKVIAEINHPEYNNQYVYFDYPMLLTIFQSIKKTDVCELPDQLLEYYYEIQSYLQYIPADGGPVFSNEDVDIIKYTFTKLMTYLRTLKDDVTIAYQKYGKHNFID